MAVPVSEIRRVLDPPIESWGERPALRDAAVLILWAAGRGGDRLVFTLRKEHLSNHGGEISFPGGSREGGESPMACALREGREEIGLDPGTVEILGSLPPRPSIAGFLVHPFLGRIGDTSGLVPDPGEVERILEIPLADLRDDRNWTWKELSPPPYRRTMPFFMIHGPEGRPLWGLTALFVRELCRRLSS